MRPDEVPAAMLAEADAPAQNAAPRDPHPLVPLMCLRTAIETTPPPRDYVLPGLLAGTVGVIASPGGAGKSMWSIEAACGVASAPANAALLRLDISQHGRAVLLNAEDPEIELAHRLHALGRYLSPAAREEIYVHLHVAPLIGAGTDLLSADWQDALAAAAQGARLVVLDTLRRWHAGDENSNGEMAAVMRVIERVAASTGAAIVCLHHVSKGSAIAGTGDTAQASRGASVITDNARWAATLTRMSSSEATQLGVPDEHRQRYVRYSLPKTNYSAPLPDVWYERGDGGVLVPATALGGLPVSEPEAAAPKKLRTARRAAPAPAPTAPTDLAGLMSLADLTGDLVPPLSSSRNATPWVPLRDLPAAIAELEREPPDVEPWI